MEYNESDVVNFFEVNSVDKGPKNEKKELFEKRLRIFGQGMLQDFNYSDAVIIGGSLRTLLDSKVLDEQLKHSESDIDLFITCNACQDISCLRTQECLDKLERVLQHFFQYAKQENLDIIFVQRGMLIDVLVEGKRSVQVIMTRYTSAEQCLSYLSMGHLHMYYNGQLFATKLAIECMKSNNTVICRAPVKDVKANDMLAKGLTPDGFLLTTKMDKSFHNALKSLKNLKDLVDSGSSQSPALEEKEKELCAQIFTHVDDTLTATRTLCEWNWNEHRQEYLDLYCVEHDLDIFDLHIRLPAHASLIERLRWFPSKSGVAGDLSKIDISTPNRQLMPSPAIFIANGVRLERDVYLGETRDVLTCMQLVQNADVAELCECVLPKAVDFIFLYNSSFSKYLDEYRMPVLNKAVKADRLYTVSFMLLKIEIDEGASGHGESIIAEIYEIYEMSRERNQKRLSISINEMR